MNNVFAVYIREPREDLSRASVQAIIHYARGSRRKDGQGKKTYLTQFAAFSSVNRLLRIRLNSSPPVASSKVKNHLKSARPKQTRTSTTDLSRDSKWSSKRTTFGC